jgi:hypothetical protein
MPANREPLHEGSDRDSYYYRRSLTTRDYLMAAGIAVGVGMAAFYVASRFAQRTPLLDEAQPTLPRKRRSKVVAG